MMIEIEKNVPIPPRGGVNKANSKYKHLNKIIESWEVGDSVAFEFVAKTTGKDRRSSYSLEANSFMTRAKNAGQKTAQRVIADEGVLRVWRVE
jgi:3-methyladenine DNA glycosylase AlkD